MCIYNECGGVCVYIMSVEVMRGHICIYNECGGVCVYIMSVKVYVYIS